MRRKQSIKLSDLHMVVLSWLNFHPGHTPEDIAKGLRAEKDVDEIAKLCADLVVGGFNRGHDAALRGRGGHGPAWR